MHKVDDDPNRLGNGDLAIRTDNGTLVALVYARADSATTRRYAEVIASALNAAFCPTMTDLMVAAESISDWLAENPQYVRDLTPPKE